VSAPPSRAEKRFYAAASLALALHALADGFSRQPGPDFRDHIAAIVVPLAVLAALLSCYPRMRAGARATADLALGALALVGAGVTIAGLGVDSFGLITFTGILLAPAGTGLVVLGVSLLWRSRKTEGHRYLRRALVALGAAAVAFEIVVPIALAIVATHRPADAPAPADLGRPYKSVHLQTADGFDLSAWWVPSQNGAAVITLPDRTWTVDQSRMLAEAGYGVLALDIRGYGTSDGDPNAYGWGATPDVDAAVDFLRSEPNVDANRIGALGLSMGGELALQAAVENNSLQAVVSDGAGERSVKETLLYGPKAILALPMMAVQTTAVAIFSGDMPPPSLGDLVGQIAPRAVFLIEAENGAGGEDLNSEYFEGAGDPKQMWQVAGASHTEGLETQPAAYQRRVVGFFDHYLRSDD
jgi:pimeloyl-ACP methyl ester carboxylesterase